MGDLGTKEGETWQNVIFSPKFVFFFLITLRRFGGNFFNGFYYMLHTLLVSKV